MISPRKFPAQKSPTVAEKRGLRIFVPDVQSVPDYTEIEITLEESHYRMIVRMVYRCRRLVHDFPARVQNTLGDADVLKNLQVLREARGFPDVFTDSSIHC